MIVVAVIHKGNSINNSLTNVWVKILCTFFYWIDRLDVRNVLFLNYTRLLNNLFCHRISRLCLWVLLLRFDSREIFEHALPPWLALGLRLRGLNVWSFLATDTYITIPPFIIFFTSINFLSVGVSSSDLVTRLLSFDLFTYFVISFWILGQATSAWPLSNSIFGKTFALIVDYLLFFFLVLLWFRLTKILVSAVVSLDFCLSLFLDISSFNSQLFFFKIRGG